MTDFDVLARLRQLEAKLGTALDRIGQLERTQRRYNDAPAYKQEREYSPTPEECYGAMIHAMSNRDAKD